jgi:Spy/CpxP family protein refolding chaperone
MKRILSMWAILMLSLLVFGGLAVAQEEEEEAAETKTIETQITTQTPPCRLMMQPMGQMMPGMMGQGQMGCGMMGGGMACCDMMGCGMMGGMGQGGGQRGMMCDPCCKQLCELGCPGCFVKMAAELELSEKQVNDLKAICAAHKKEVIRKKADIKIALVELSDLVSQRDVDLTKVRAKLTEIGSMKQSMCLAQLATIEKARRVLTSEQLTKFKDMKKEMCGMGMKPGTMPKMKKVIKMKMGE